MSKDSHTPGKPIQLPHAKIVVFEHEGELKTNLTLHPDLDRSQPCPPYVTLAHKMVKLAYEGVPFNEMALAMHGAITAMPPEVRVRTFGRLFDGFCVKCGEAQASCKCSAIIVPGNFRA